MKINWFPGHMTKTLRMIEAEISLCDIVFYICDSRIVKSSFNAELIEKLGNKPIIYVLNKADLADSAETQKWKERLKTAIITNSSISGSVKNIIDLANKILKPTLEKYKAKGITKPLRAMVVGIPNSGKSTLINNLAKKAKTITGNKPGVTRGKQWVRITEGLELLDTPGTLWPNLGNIETGENLALAGSVKDDVLDITLLAQVLILRLKKLKPKEFTERYNLENSDKTELEILKEIAKKRGCILKNNEPDLERAAKVLLSDFRSGKLGRISLEAI